MRFDSVKKLVRPKRRQGGDGKEVAEASNSCQGVGRLDENLCASPRTLSDVSLGEFGGLSATAWGRS